MKFIELYVLVVCRVVFAPASAEYCELLDACTSTCRIVLDILDINQVVIMADMHIVCPDT